MFHTNRFTALVVPVCLVAASTLQAESFQQPAPKPYTVFVAQAKSHAYSGAPSEKHVPYRTDPLRHGQQLEVYAETADGWLRVRPPEGSFSWIAADQVDVDQSGQTGLVNEDQTVAWVGTQLGRARKFGWQVRLAKDEAVTIIGRSQREGPDGPQLWFRIVPPSGEFRFIHRSQVVDTSEELVAALAGHDFEETGRKTSFIKAGPDPGATSPRDDVAASEATTTDQVTRLNDLPASSRARIDADARAVADARPHSQSPSDAFPIAKNEHTSSRRVRPLVPSSGESVLERPTTETFSDQAIGSGVQSIAQAQLQPPQLIPPPTLPPTLTEPARPSSQGALAFLGRPRLSEITRSTAAPTNLAASNSTQPSASPRVEEAFPVSPVSSNSSASEIAQVAGIAPLPAQTLTPARPSVGLRPQHHSAVANAGFTTTTPKNLVVSQQRIRQLERQASAADTTGLQILLSELMTAQSSAGEARVIAEAARRLANSRPPGQSQQAQMIADRAQQYVQLAMQRDGTHLIETRPVPSVPAPNDSRLPVASSSMSPNSLDGAVIAAPAQPESFSISGQLVEVYSARTHSPPFALTDATGRTIAYVTPSPGINLRMHLNQQITVQGQRGLVPEMNLPHVFAHAATQVAAIESSFR